MDKFMRGNDAVLGIPRYGVRNTDDVLRVGYLKESVRCKPADSRCRELLKGLIPIPAP